MELTNKVALVTGAASGIGQAIALTLAREGAKVGIADLNREGIQKTIDLIVADGGEALELTGDVSDKAQVDGMTAKLCNRFGPVDILVNNAGIGGAKTLIHEIPETVWDKVMAVNLKAAFLTCKAVIPTMMERQAGKIVNVASLAARRISYSAGADYTASKYGLVGFTLTLAYEMAKYKINVNAICPGATLTPLIRANLPTERLQEMAKQIPLGRWCTPTDHAEAVLFLVSDRALIITGMIMDVDGGNMLSFGDYLHDMKRRESRAKELKVDTKEGG